MPAVSTHPRRIALYSHDTQGLGHTRRNTTLAAALVAAHPDTDVLLLTGNPEAAMLPLPPRTDVRVGSRLHQCRGQRDVAAGVPEALGVVRVEGDPPQARGGPGRTGRSG